MLRRVVCSRDKVLLLSQMAGAPFRAAPRRAQARMSQLGRLPRKSRHTVFRYGAGRITGAKWSVPSSRAVAEPTHRPRGWLLSRLLQPQQQIRKARRAYRRPACRAHRKQRCRTAHASPERWRAVAESRRASRRSPPVWSRADSAAGGQARWPARSGTSLPCFGLLSATKGCERGTRGCGSHVPAPIPGPSILHKFDAISGN